MHVVFKMFLLHYLAVRVLCATFNSSYYIALFTVTRLLNKNSNFTLQNMGVAIPLLPKLLCSFFLDFVTCVNENK